MPKFQAGCQAQVLCLGSALDAIEFLYGRQDQVHSQGPQSEPRRPLAGYDRRKLQEEIQRIFQITLSGARWVELALERSQTRIQLARASSNLEPKEVRNRPKSASVAKDATNIPNPL